MLKRISPEQALEMLKNRDIISLGKLAHKMRTEKHGDKTYYIVNQHINYTNVCINGCRFCAFSQKEGSPNGITMTLDEIESKAEALNPRVSELHIVGGCHPGLPYEYYIEMLERLHNKHPDVHLQAFTAVEIAHIAEMGKRTVKETLQDLKKAGLGSIPGGGAEVFSPRVRAKVCEEKLSGEKWLEVMRTAHKLGIRSNATMLYGHVETDEEIVDHLTKLRNLQDETGGFLSFIPLPYHPFNTPMGGRGLTPGVRDIQVFTTARMFLDNFDHIKAFWIMLTPKFAQVLLHFGANDLDGTVVEEKITHSAGAQTPQAMSIKEIHHLIKSAGFIPVERDTLYNVKAKI